MPFFKVHEIDLHYVERGSGPPLVLVHGFPLDHTMWVGQIDVLSKSHRVIAPDLRGFGQSGVTAGLATMPRMADDLFELLSGLAVHEPVILCGLSMGGYVAWQFARRYPEQIAKLIACDTRAIADTPEAAANRIALAERVLKEGPAFVAESMLPKLFAPATLASKAPCVEATRAVIMRTDPKGIAAASRGMAQRPDVTPWLAQIDVPALVVCGQHDAISTVDEMRGIAQSLPRAKFVEIAGAGHMSPLEKPAEFNAAVSEFLR